MPTAPRYGGPKVGTAPLDIPRVATDVPQGAGGLGFQIDLGGIDRALTTELSRELDDFNRAELNRAEAEANELENRILHDPERGILAMRGKNSLDSRKVLDEQWTKGVSEIEKTLENDTQRQAFRRAVTVRKGTLDDAASRHISKELEEYTQEQVIALIDGERNAAIATAVPGANADEVSERTSLAIGRQRAAIADWARKRGVSEERLQLRLAEETSRTHALVIARMVDNEDDIQAKKYYERVKENLVGQDLVKVEQAIEASSLRSESQRIADDIGAKYSTHSEAIAAVKKLQKGKLRDEVEQRVDHDFTRRRTLERERENDVYLRATNLLDSNPGSNPRDVIPQSVWSQLSLGAREALERRAGDRANDDKTWLSFLELPYQDVAKLTRKEFEEKYWSKLDNSTRKRAEEQWNSSRNAVETGRVSAKMAADITFKDQVDKTLRSGGFVSQSESVSSMNKDDYRFYADFLLEATRMKEAFETEKQRPATSTEMQEIIGNLTKQRIFIDGWRDQKRLPGTVSRDERKNAFVPIKEIPPNIKAELESIVQQSVLARGRAYNLTGAKIKDAVQRLYAARLLDDRDLFRQILAEKF